MTYTLLHVGEANMLDTINIEMEVALVHKVAYDVASICLLLSNIVVEEVVVLP